MEDLPGHLEQQHDQVDRRGGRGLGPTYRSSLGLAGSFRSPDLPDRVRPRRHPHQYYAILQDRLNLEPSLDPVAGGSRPARGDRRRTN